ncbi:uncharacterized protein [Antedon mediterranea]|uniref:uncharacterized protein isoform X2 n=1 Tax=Antedon mediterranea TaxID=105859 RepID=UPI003AF5AA26
MRPEKHQKIRKHQKNKHGKSGQGQSSGSKKKSVNDDGKSGSKSSHQKPDNSNTIRRPHGRHGVDSHSPQQSASSSSSEGLKSESGERKSFSRRKIESNWNRYGDIEEDDDKVEIRGADFNVLLSKEDSSSQFRFKDEQDWQDDVYQEDNSDFLCLNVQSLVTQLQCLPISQRLNIDEEVFTIYEKDSGIQNSREEEMKTDPCLETNFPDQVEKKRKPDVIFNVDASKETFDFSLHKSEIYSKKQSVIKSTINQSEPDRTGISEENVGSMIAEPYRTGISEKNVGSMIAEPDRTGISEKNVGSMIAEPDRTGINWKNPVHGTNKAISKPKVQQKKEEEDNDDELDFLLGLDNPINTTRHQNKNNQEPETELNIEKEEESILSKPKKTEFVNSKKNEDEGNLEDWLDSMLDD